MSDNYPLGADNDPNAPWNRSEKFCRYCDHYLIMQLAEEIYAEPDNTMEMEELITSLFNEATLCPHCLEEEIADFRDDY